MPKVIPPDGYARTKPYAADACYLLTIQKGGTENGAQLFTVLSVFGCSLAVLL
jgi:hypothetical protein